MTWGNPPKLKLTKPKQGKAIQPEDIAKGSEHSHQVALFAWAALSVGKYPQLKWMFAIPNGGLRDMRTAVNLKAEGVKAGVPDVFLPVIGYHYFGDPERKCAKSYHGLFIEMKIGKNKPTQEQWAWMSALESNGYLTKVCYGWEEARDTIVNYLEGKL